MSLKGGDGGEPSNVCREIIRKNTPDLLF